MRKHTPLGVSTGNSPSELDLTTEEDMQAALHIESTFLDFSCSSTAGHISHSVPELRCAETTSFASQLEAHLQAATTELFQHNILEQSACEVAYRDPRYLLKSWRWSGLDTNVRG
jgi:hypothetical protein